MFKIVLVVLAIGTNAYTAEISSSYSSLEKHAAFTPDMKTEPIETHASSREAKADVTHPVYKPEAPKVRGQGRARIEPVRPLGPVIKNDAMLADQPPVPTEVNTKNTELNRVDDMGILGNGYYPNTAEVAYPDIPYAPGYLYDTAYSSPNMYDMYGSNTDLMDPDTSMFSLLWSQVPYGRTLVSYVGRTIAWIFNSIFVLFIGSALTVAVCSYTNLCTIAFHGVGPIHEEMRALISPERLENISNAADFVKTAINKFQKIQKVSEESPNVRKRRDIFNY